MQKILDLIQLLFIKSNQHSIKKFNNHIISFVCAILFTNDQGIDKNLFIVALNKNDVAKYSHIKTISHPLFDKIVAFVKGSRLMTERRMVANKRKLARKLTQMKRKQSKVKQAA